MFVGKVIGNVWATRKHKHLRGLKLLLVKALDDCGNQTGEAILTVDSGIGAGPEDIVLVIDEGGSARKILGNPKSPVRTAVAGIIDTINLNGKEKKYA